MKRCWLLLLLAALALGACQPGPTPAAATPTAALATISALLPTTLAAYHLPDAPTPRPSPTYQPLNQYPAPATSVAVTPMPLAPIIGQHTVQPGETIFCIGRAYGVLPAAIAEANGLSQTFSISAGQVLHIPAMQWTSIPEGPVCAPQFQSPFPGLAAPTAAPSASRTPARAPLVLSLNWSCIDNCGAKDGNYIIEVVMSVSGGVAPYTYHPGQMYDVSVPHCTNGQGTAIVTSADGQSAQQGWVYADVACPAGDPGY